MKRYILIAVVALSALPAAAESGAASSGVSQAVSAQATQAAQRAALAAATQLQTQQNTSGNTGFGGSSGAAIQAKPTPTPPASSSSGTSQSPGAAVNDGKASDVGSTNGSIAPISTPSANDSANKGKSSQNMGQIVNVVAGAGFMSYGAYLNCCGGGGGTPFLIMGGLALVQGAMMGGNASDSGKTADATVECYLPPCNGQPTTPTDPSDPTKRPPGDDAKPPGGGVDGPKGGFSNKDIKEGLDQLKKAGYTVTPKGVTGPDGKFTPASAFSTPAGMASAGFSPSTIKDIQALAGSMEQVTSKLTPGNTVGMALADGGGGGGSDSGGGDSAAGGGAHSPSYKNPFALGKEDQQKLVAGKTVNLGGDPIGVRGQNIFEMVHSCYEKKRQRSNFIESEAAVVRAPASLPLSKAPKR